MIIYTIVCSTWYVRPVELQKVPGGQVRQSPLLPAPDMGLYVNRGHSLGPGRPLDS